MNILFRADSSSTIGTGHIMRDLVLAQQYTKKGHQIIFVTQSLTGNINHKIIEAGYKIKIIDSNELKELDKIIKKLEIDMIVIDNYDINYQYEKELKSKNSGLKILSFDDTYEKHHCDILLNHNIYAKKERYKKLVPKTCELHCGIQYTLLREEFLIEKKKKTILLAMGGADSAELNIEILKILKKYNHIKVIVITTSANQNLQTLKEYIRNKKWIKLIINSLHIAELIKKVDFAITTPSVTLNELYFMKISFIAIKIAENQKEMYKYLKQKHFDVLKKFNEKNFSHLLNKYLKENT